MGFLGAATQSIPLELQPMAEHGKKMWRADYPQVACSVQWEPLVTTDRSCLTLLALPKGEWYLLGRGKELPIPLWLHEALQEQEAQVVRLQGEVTAARAAQEQAVQTLQEALRNQGIEVTRLEGELAEVQAARERAVEEKELEIQNLRGELAVQRDAHMQLNREFMAFQNSNGIRQVYRLKRWLRRFRR
jgi:hypothetical protein